MRETSVQLTKVDAPKPRIANLHEFGLRFGANPAFDTRTMVAGAKTYTLLSDGDETIRGGRTAQDADCTFVRGVSRKT